MGDMAEDGTAEVLTLEPAAAEERMRQALRNIYEELEDYAAMRDGVSSHVLKSMIEQIGKHVGKVSDVVWPDNF